MASFSIKPALSKLPHLKEHPFFVPSKSFPVPVRFWPLCSLPCPAAVHPYPTPAEPHHRLCHSAQLKPSKVSTFSESASGIHKALCGVGPVSSPGADTACRFASAPVVPSVFLGYTPHTPPQGLCTCCSLSQGVLSFPRYPRSFPLYLLDILLHCPLLTEDVSGHLLTVWQVLPHTLQYPSPNLILFSSIYRFHFLMYF